MNARPIIFTAILLALGFAFLLHQSSQTRRGLELEVENLKLQLHSSRKEAEDEAPSKLRKPIPPVTAPSVLNDVKAPTSSTGGDSGDEVKALKQQIQALKESHPDYDLEGCMDPALPKVDLGVYRLCANIPNIRLACTKGGDAVCDAIRDYGYWEQFIYDALLYGVRRLNYKMDAFKKKVPKAFVIDIGGNVGAFAVRMAAEGHVVHAFEMLPRNVQMIKTSRCLNKLTEDQLRVYHTGLGSVARTCNMISGPDSNDGMVDCSGRSAEELKPRKIDGVVTIKTIDEMWDKAPFGAMIDNNTPNVVKVDVEGFEILVMEGASRLLSHENKPRLIMTEVWSSLDFVHYAKVMLRHGYVAFEYLSRTWIGDMAGAAAYQKRTDRGVDTVAWVYKDFYHDFIHAFGQGSIPRDDAVLTRAAQAERQLLVSSS